MTRRELLAASTYPVVVPLLDAAHKCERSGNESDGECVWIEFFDERGVIEYWYEEHCTCGAIRVYRLLTWEHWHDGDGQKGELHMRGPWSARPMEWLEAYGRYGFCERRGSWDDEWSATPTCFAPVDPKALRLQGLLNDIDRMNAASIERAPRA